MGWSVPAASAPAGIRELITSRLGKQLVPPLTPDERRILEAVCARGEVTACLLLELWSTLAPQVVANEEPYFWDEEC